MVIFTLLDLIITAFGLFVLNKIFKSKHPLPLPPGPKGWPLIGNLLDMPAENEWKTFAKWGETWGDVCSVTVLGQTVVILNSPDAAIDMLDKQSPIYSDRPKLQMGGELVGWKNTLVLLPYGNRFRNFRKLFHRCIGNHASMKRFLPIEEAETHRFLRRVLNAPEDLAEHVRKASGAIILRISHGYEVKENKDPFVDLANQATEQFSLSTAPGGYLVDVIPALKHIPEWFPGASFKKQASVWSTTLCAMVNQPHYFVKQQMAAGIAPVSFTSCLLENKPLSSEEEEDIKWCAASLYSGGSDTTVSAVYAFFLAMALCPDVAKKAQAEIDSVVGNHRLPSFTDRPQLPYIDALTKEVLRWNSVVPTAVPHRATEDSVHDGWLIPKGTLVIPNIWKMTHDPRVYVNPMTFDPSRFIGSGERQPERDPREIVFGFGRRICPGQHLADASVFIACAMSLAVFNISKCVENGVVVEVVHENTTGTISHPKPFRCSITPRSDLAKALIQSDERI